MRIPEGTICDDKVIEEILSNGKYTTLALSDGNDSYVLTLFYGYGHDRKTLYFNSTRKGTKFDFLKSNSYVSGTVVLNPERDKGQHLSSYLSVVYRGLVEVIHDEDEKREALRLIYQKIGNSDLSDEGVNAELSGSDTLVMKLMIDEMTARCFPVPGF